MPNSVLEAIKDGVWDFEPSDRSKEDYEKTVALPGTGEKLTILAHRLELGLPLWHPQDRLTFDDSESA